MFVLAADDLTDITTVFRQGGSSRSIGFTFMGADALFPEAGTLLVPVTITALDLTGGGSRVYDVSDSSGAARITFDAAGRFAILDVDQSMGTGTWSINGSGVLLTLVIDGTDDIISTVLLDGDFPTGGTLLVAVGTTGEFWPIWEDIFDAPIAPVQF